MLQKSSTAASPLHEGIYDRHTYVQKSCTAFQLTTEKRMTNVWVWKLETPQNASAYTGEEQPFRVSEKGNGSLTDLNFKNAALMIPNLVSVYDCEFLPALLTGATGAQ